MIYLIDKDSNRSQKIKKLWEKKETVKTVVNPHSLDLLEWEKSLNSKEDIFFLFSVSSEEEEKEVHQILDEVYAKIPKEIASLHIGHYKVFPRKQLDTIAIPETEEPVLYLIEESLNVTEWEARHYQAKKQGIQLSVEDPLMPDDKTVEIYLSYVNSVSAWKNRLHHVGPRIEKGKTYGKKKRKTTTNHSKDETSK